jgi:bifunctional non-homologous end joining protein LigD
MTLRSYLKRRDFNKTPEPFFGGKRKKPPIFVMQRHDARQLHYDFRIQIGPVLKSWAVPKGPPKAFSDKRLSIPTDDHPLGYADFEGIIPKGEYGAGTVKIYDRGCFKNLKKQSLNSCWKKGRIEIFLEGKKMKGPYALIRFREKAWLLIKMKKHVVEP